jgi:3-oxoacyl-(acyl-carrier-protein) synthase
MENNRYYINGVGMISPQRTFDNAEFLPVIEDYPSNSLSCVTPDFKSYINPIQLRRLSRLQRIGLAAAVIAMNDSGLSQIDGIVTASGNGSSQSKSSFIQEVLTQNEKQITPTHFLQSSYNSLAGLVAMTYRCQGYNSNHVSNGIAFETALQDTMLQLADNPLMNFLVGAYDESYEDHFELDNRTGQFKRELGSSLELFERKTKGTLYGEGAAFFCLSSLPSGKTWCAISEPMTVYKPQNAIELCREVEEFLAKNGTEKNAIDVFISGATGDPSADHLIHQTADSLFSLVTQCRFKHLCGEYFTASSFAVWLGASMVKKNVVPLSTRFSLTRPPTEINKVLIVNHYHNANYSFLLLEKINH